MTHSEKKLNVVIPMAGFGTRLRPHTWSKPKALVQVAGKTVLDHVLDMVSTAANLDDCRLAFIVGYLGDQIRSHMAEHYPNVETNFYVQEKMLGQTHAIAMAREQMYGPTLVMFSDTLVEDDLSFLSDPNANFDGVVWVKRVDDPRRFGVVVVGEDGFVSDIIEKPDGFENDLAIVGYYYFSKGEDLMAAIDTQLNNNMMTKGEFYIADAMKIMMENGLKLLPKPVDVWLDAGVPDTVLETNRYLLEHGRDNTADISAEDGLKINPPVNIHPTAILRNSTIGPDVTIGAGCKVENSKISYSVIEQEAEISDSKLSESLVGERAVVSGLSGQFVIGDDSTIKGE